MFTTNLAQAAPIVVSREHMARSGGHARAVVINSGCANACTGADGLAQGKSPDRLDALVWALTDLMLTNPRSPTIRTL